MKKAILYVVVFIMCVSAHAQQPTASGYSDSYALYYSPISRGPNGFRTVEEEDRLMTETIAQLRRERDKEEMSEVEIARAVKKHDNDIATQKRIFEANKKEAPKAKK